MTLFTILAALGLERWRPLRPEAPRQLARDGLAWVQVHMNAGGEQRGALAWTVGALLPALAAGGVSMLLSAAWMPLAWVFNVVVLYFCLGFKAASYRAADIVRALRTGQMDEARSLLGDWRPALLAGADESSLVRQTLEETLRQSVARMFGVLFWFLPFGAAGALLYLLTRMARDRWEGEPEFGRFARRVAAWLDWLPVRLVAFSFAIVGNFQDAQEAWRNQATSWGDENDGVLLAAAAGALGLRLGGVVTLPDGELVRPDLGPEEPRGVEPHRDNLDHVVALIWRAALLWLAVLGLLWLGSL